MTTDSLPKSAASFQASTRCRQRTLKESDPVRAGSLVVLWFYDGYILVENLADMLENYRVSISSQSTWWYYALYYVRCYSRMLFW